MFTALGINAQFTTDEKFKDSEIPWIKTSEQLVVQPITLAAKHYSSSHHLYTNTRVVDGEELVVNNNEFISSNVKKYIDIESIDSNRAISIHTIFYTLYYEFIQQNDLGEVALSGIDFDNAFKDYFYLNLAERYPDSNPDNFKLALLNNTYTNTSFQVYAGSMYFYKIIYTGPEISKIEIVKTEFDGTILQTIDFTEFLTSQAYIDQPNLETKPSLHIVGNYLFCTYGYNACEVYQIDFLAETIQFKHEIITDVPSNASIDGIYVTDDFSKFIMYAKIDNITHSFIYNMTNLYISSIDMKQFPGICKFVDSNNFLSWDLGYFKLYPTTNYIVPVNASKGELFIKDVTASNFTYYNNTLYISDAVISLKLGDLFEVPLPSSNTLFPSNTFKKIQSKTINKLLIEAVHGSSYYKESELISIDSVPNNTITEKAPISWQYNNNLLYVEYGISNIKSIRYMLKVHVPKGLRIVETNTIFTTLQRNT